jgi:hypothetical protein
MIPSTILSAYAQTKKAAIKLYPEQLRYLVS